MTPDHEATIGPRGHVVLPESIRAAAGVRPGMAVTVSVEGDRIVIEPSTGELDDFLRASPKRPEPASVDWDERYYTPSPE